MHIILGEKKIAKKGKVYTRQLRPRSDVVGFIKFEGIMRDIMPDEKYEVLGVHNTCSNKTGTGNVLYMALARNVDAEEAVSVAESLQFKSGCFYHYEPNSEAVAGTAWFGTDVRNFPAPIEFDEDDKLNFAMYNSQAQTSGFVADLFYRRI